jgi:hypothetical protein
MAVTQRGTAGGQGKAEFVLTTTPHSLRRSVLLGPAGVGARSANRVKTPERLDVFRVEAVRGRLADLVE